MLDKRVVKVDKKFYRELLQYLHPLERFAEEENGTMAIVLLTYGADGDGSSLKKLSFVRDKNA